MAYSYSPGSYGAGLYSAEDTADTASVSSWSFSIDGHQFVFVRLGTEGTYVLDTSSGNWLSWGLDGSVGLNFRDGQPFGEFCLMGSQETGDIYSFDPDSLDDEAGPFEIVVTGGVGAKAREVIECYSAYLQGNRSDATDRDVKLFISDDNGKTWIDCGAVTPDTETFEMAWRSLGTIKAPGRLFEIRDYGALKSIDGLAVS